MENPNEIAVLKSFPHLHKVDEGVMKYLEEPLQSTD